MLLSPAKVSTSGRSGKHSSPVTAGDWRTSLFAPALALASTSTIKVSRGFEAAEWGSTALKLKLPKRSAGGSMKSLPGRAKAPGDTGRYGEIWGDMGR